MDQVSHPQRNSIFPPNSQANATPFMMKKSIQKLHTNFSPSSSIISPFLSSSSSSSSCFSTDTNTNNSIKLTQQELHQINLLIPRLCASNHQNDAVRLLHTALLANPPLHSLSLPVLIRSLSSDPGLTRPMSFLTRIKHFPPTHYSLIPISKMFLSTYFQMGRVRFAVKVFQWMTRHDCPVDPDYELCAMGVSGLVGNGEVLEGVKGLRVLVKAGFVPDSELRLRVFRGLLREARVREAQELDEGIGCVGVGDGAAKVVAFLDHMITNWEE